VSAGLPYPFEPVGRKWNFREYNPAWDHRIRVTVRSLTSDLLIGTGVTHQVDGAQANPTADGTTRLLGEPLEKGDTYTISAYVPDPSADQMRRSERLVGGYPPGVTNSTGIYLPKSGESATKGADLAGDGSPGAALTGRDLLVVRPRGAPWGGTSDAPRLLRRSPYGEMYNLARSLAAGQPTAYDIVKAIERHLQEEYTYSDPGDGSDIVEGEGDQDTLLFNGSSAAELMTASANGSRLKFTRDVGNIVMDTAGVETLAVNALGGADSLTIGTLAGTDVTAANIDLGVNGAGDAAADSVTVDGTGAADVIQAAAVSGTVQVTGLTAALNVTRPEAANDRLTINGLGGSDTISGGPLAALTGLTLDGGDANDTLNGGNGADTLIGGTGNDTIDGNQGNDVALMADGNDTFVWDPGDGSDIAEGQGGRDTLRFNGSAGAEIFAASSNGGRLLFTRNVGNIVMDTDDVEILTLNALGGTDTITLNDLAATEVDTVDVDLGVAGAGDSAADAVTINGTVGVDLFALSGSGGTVSVNSTSLAATITNSQPANDTLTISTSAGDDQVSASSLANSSTLLTINGGPDDDILVGSQGNDTINGEAGNDEMFGESGNDTLTGGDGTDTATGGAGNDVDGGGNETFIQ
jgi:Ca2+-binding RTX toxin-like protein